MPPNSRGRRRLAPEELHHPHAGEVFLEVAVEPGQAEPDVAEGVAHLAAEDAGQEVHERNDRERHQRQAPVGHQHQHHDRGRVKRSPKTVTTPRGEELVERLDVGGDPSHQPADGVPVEVRDAEPLQVLEDLRAAGRA